MAPVRHTLRVYFAPGAHLGRDARDRIAALLGGVREQRHLRADFIIVSRCRRGLTAGVGVLAGMPGVVAVEEAGQRVTLSRDWERAIASAPSLVELELLVPALRQLPETNRAPLRPVWLARRTRLLALGSPAPRSAGT